MAGDWIKLEHATAAKPEITLAAELLNISRREALGLMIDYWIWLDQNIDDERNGFVTHVSRKSVESVLHCPGLAAVLEAIGWAIFDDKALSMQVTHWSRHNGNTAKTRALTRDRQLRFRNAAVTVDALPEKRREEILQKRSTADTPVDNSAPRSWAAHWIAQGKALGINALKGETTTAYCHRVQAHAKTTR